jgi:hypothetical protein
MIKWIAGESLSDWLMVIVTAAAAIYALENVQELRHQAREENRALVVVKRYQTDQLHASGQPFPVNIFIGNTGKTPAKAVKIYASECPLHESDGPPDFAHNRCQAHESKKPLKPSCVPEKLDENDGRYVEEAANGILGPEVERKLTLLHNCLTQGGAIFFRGR